jgi:hypothetical protein
LLLEALQRSAVWGMRSHVVFDLEAANDGILITSMPLWPKHGFTCAMWLMLEHPTVEAWNEATSGPVRGATLFKFRGSDGVGVRVSLNGAAVVLTSYGEGGKEVVRTQRLQCRRLRGSGAPGFVTVCVCVRLGAARPPSH